MNTRPTSNARLVTALLCALLLLALPAHAQSGSMTDDAMMDDKDGAMMDDKMEDDPDGVSPWAIGIGAAVLVAVLVGVVLFVRSRGGA